MHDAPNGDLQAHAKYKEGHNAVDYFFVMRTDIAHHAVGVEVKNKDEDAYPDNGKQQGRYIHHVKRHMLIRFACAKGKQYRNSARAGSDREGDRIKKFIFNQRDMIHLVRSCCGLGISIIVAVRTKKSPANFTDHDATRQLDDRNSKAEDLEDIMPCEQGHRANDKGVKCDLPHHNKPFFAG